MYRRFRVVLLWVAALAGLVPAAWSAPVANTIFNFTGSGRAPLGGLTRGPNGDFYGTTSYAPYDSKQGGTIFRITADGAFTTVYRFNGNSEGALPAGPLLYDADGCFYGTTSVGDYTGIPGGALFRFDPATNKLTVLARFPNSEVPGAFQSNEYGARFPLVRGRDGALYGTVYSFGGIVVFRYTAAGTLENMATLRGFPGGSSLPGDGGFLVAGPDGLIYGTVGMGGSQGDGEFFRLEADGTVTDLLDFVGNTPTGYFPVGQLVLAPDGNFYGATGHGGANGGGLIYRVSTSGEFTPIYEFPPNDGGGFAPATGLTLGQDGFLYGVTSGGGATVNSGVAFRVSLQGDYKVLTTAYDAYAGTLSPLTLGVDGNFYGTALAGSSSLNGRDLAAQDVDSRQGGAIYQLKPDGTFRYLHVFDRTAAAAGEDGGRVNSGLIVARDGNLYGTASGLGDFGDGYVFRLTPVGAFTVLAQFHGPDGSFPTAELIQARDGNFYGVTAHGGAYGGGVVFRMTPDGALTTLWDFDLRLDGYDPEAPLIQARDGNLYGTTTFGGVNGAGTIFRVDPATGLHAVVTNLPPVINPGAIIDSNPGLVEGLDGNFYGVTTNRGLDEQGTVYRCTPSGGLSDVFHFDSRTGESPRATLLRGIDGALYGTTSLGGPSNLGTVFRLTVDGQYKILGSYDGEEVPFNGEPALIQSADGTLYGATATEVFSLAPDGTRASLYALHQEGSSLAAPVVQAPDGTFYVTPIAGGKNGYGSVVSLRVPGAAAIPPPPPPGAVSLTPRVMVTGKAAGKAPAAVAVNRNPSDDPSVPLTVFYAVHGSAVNGIDYKPLTGVCTIPAGQASASILIKPRARARHPAGTTLTVKLSLANGPGYTVATAGAVKVKIKY